MIKKKIKKKDLIINKSASESQELNEMPLDKMDFDIAKKIISDYLTEGTPVEEIEIEHLGEDNFVTLEVENLQDGLKWKKLRV